MSGKKCCLSWNAWGPEHRYFDLLVQFSVVVLNAPLPDSLKDNNLWQTLRTKHLLLVTRWPAM